MGKAKISITGTPEKKPKFNVDGTVDLIFRINMTEQVPKGLKSLGESIYLVHVSEKSWKKVSNIFKDDSFYIIQGETKANKTTSGAPIIEVVAFDISIKVPGEKDPKENIPGPVKEKEQLQQPTQKGLEKARDEIKTLPQKTKEKEFIKRGSLPPLPKTKKELQRTGPVQWFVPDEIKHVPLNDVILVEQIHLTAQRIEMNGILKTVQASKELRIPLAVRPIDGSQGKYALVMGLRSYCVAKMLGIDPVPVVIRNMDHKELSQKMEVAALEQ